MISLYAAKAEKATVKCAAVFDNEHFSKNVRRGYGQEAEKDEGRDIFGVWLAS
jgi:hypothetical protein